MHSNGLVQSSLKHWKWDESTDKIKWIDLNELLLLYEYLLRQCSRIYFNYKNMYYRRDLSLLPPQTVQLQSLLFGHLLHDHLYLCSVDELLSSQASFRRISARWRFYTLTFHLSFDICVNWRHFALFIRDQTGTTF